MNSLFKPGPAPVGNLFRPAAFRFPVDALVARFDRSVTRGNGGANGPVSRSAQHLDACSTGTGAQVELGRLAQQQGAAPAVRAFGAQIAAEHARMHARLTTASERVGMVPTPAAPNLSGFSALSGPEFDREFITDQVKNQREALGLYESEAQAGQDPRLRSVARESLPLLRRDLQRTEELAARLGA